MSRKSVIAIAAVASLVLAGGVAYASIPDGGVIHGCYKTQNGQLRVIDSGGCGPSEAALDWNQTGPTGAQGATGPTGPSGPPGPSGTLAWAHVAGDGTILDSSGNVNVFHFFAGGYCVGVTGVTPHAVMAVLDSHFNVGGTIQASIFHASGCPADATGIYIVTRPQFQDGGQPGVDRTFYFTVS
jgi:hypothetical protein